jgi:2-polyprenyl-3-methyl-5-hydroxy-6-metoxy-1,4-benzoquinol methylase
MSEYADYGYYNAEAFHTFGYLLEPVKSMLNKNSLILDLGCGNGYLVNQLLPDGYNAYGTDASADGIAIANKQNPGRFFIQDLAVGGLPAPLNEMRFDTIVSTEVIEHLYDPQKFIALCRQILEPKKGTLIISTPYHGYFKNLTLALLGKWDAHLDPLWQGGHIKMWSRATLSRLLEQNGFRVLEFKGCGRYPYFWKSMLIKAQLT